MSKKIIYVVGIGPGDESMMTGEAIEALDRVDTIIGYPLYIKLLGERYSKKRFLETNMKGEYKRCIMCFEEAMSGHDVALISSGDAGVYGMASLMYEVGRDYPECEIKVVAGLTAACSGSAVLGSPLSNDFCVISLSDLLTPWEKIEKRLRAAALGDFAIAIYNPSSHKRYDYLKKACEILLEYIEPERVCGYVENIGREGTKENVCTLGELKDIGVNMFTTVFIGCSATELIDGKMVTKRGYRETR